MSRHKGCRINYLGGLTRRSLNLSHKCFSLCDYWGLEVFFRDEKEDPSHGSEWVYKFGLSSLVDPEEVELMRV